MLLIISNHLNLRLPNIDCIKYRLNVNRYIE